MDDLFLKFTRFLGIMEITEFLPSCSSDLLLAEFQYSTNLTIYYGRNDAKTSKFTQGCKQKLFLSF